VARLDPKGDTREGSLVLTNTAGEACTLRGAATVRVLDTQGMTLPQQGGRLEELWKSRGFAAPRGWPVVRLEPGASAGVHVLWKSWCGNTDTPATWEIVLQDGSRVHFGVDVRQDVPNCTGGTSTLMAGPFEPFSA
jgi:hypothetical protein